MTNDLLDRVMGAPASSIPLRESAELQLLRDSARRLLEREWPAARAVALACDSSEIVRLWRMAAAQGWTALDLDDPQLGLAAALVLQQELGRAECPIPLMDGVLAAAVLAVTPGPEAVALLEGLHVGNVVPTWCFGPSGGEAAPFELSKGSARSRISVAVGDLRYVEHTQAATHLFIVTGEVGEVLIVSMADPGLTVVTTPGLHVPPLADVLLRDVTSCLPISTSFPLATLAPLARVLLAGRALGAAQHGLELLTAYAKERVQFGQKIGQFQAVQHKLANCLIGVELCRLSVVHAGQVDALTPECVYRAAVAGALAGQFLRQVVLETLHGFGGVSFWEEHEMPRHFRRVHADTTRLGGVRASRGVLADALLVPGARIPDFDLGAAGNRFRREIQDWLSIHWNRRYPPDTRDLPVNHRNARQEFSRKLGEKGWLSITWPTEYGGQARSALEHLAFEEEMAYSEAPVTFHNTAASMIGPALIRHASAAQKSRFLPAIARGDASFALGYSEAEYGSDLAGIRTSAVRAPAGAWRIKGHKTFTSTAGFATHIWLAARTDPGQARHKGISVFIVPLDAPGITIQPMAGLNGHRANTVFFDNVLVDADALVGAENAGWEVITDALAFERIALAGIAARIRGYFDRLLAHLQQPHGAGCSPREERLVRDIVGQFAGEIEGARMLAVNTALVVESGEVPVFQAAMMKVFASELMERLCEAAFDCLGTGATLKEGSHSSLIDGRFEYGVRDALLYTIGGGTNEIQRTLIAVRGLGLPR